MIDYIVPLLLFCVCTVALGKRENAYGLMLEGASEGLKLLLSLVPALILLLTAVTMLRQSGAVALLSKILSPAFPCLASRRKQPSWCWSAPFPEVPPWLWAQSSWYNMVWIPKLVEQLQSC